MATVVAVIILLVLGGFAFVATTVGLRFTARRASLLLRVGAGVRAALLLTLLLYACLLGALILRFLTISGLLLGALVWLRGATLVGAVPLPRVLTMLLRCTRLLRALVWLRGTVLV